MPKMQSTILSLVSLLLPLVAANLATPATQDATIIRSSDSTCSSCPDSDCNLCTLGLNPILQASSDGNTITQVLVQFKLPVSPSTIAQCAVQFPALVHLENNAIDITVYNAQPTPWDQATVDGDNAPEVFSRVTSFEVPPLANLPSIDITPACQGAQPDGTFSIYLAADDEPFSIWSSDSGNPAILNIVQN